MCNLFFRNEAWPIAVEWLESAAESAGGLLTSDLTGSSDPPPSPTPSDGGWAEDSVAEEASQQQGAAALQQQKLPAVSRRQKTTSECTESSISQTMLEIGPSPLEPSFQLPGTFYLAWRIIELSRVSEGVAFEG